MVDGSSSGVRFRIGNLSQFEYFCFYEVTNRRVHVKITNKKDA